MSTFTIRCVAKKHTTVRAGKMEVIDNYVYTKAYADTTS